MVFLKQLNSNTYIPGEYGLTALGGADDSPVIQAAIDAMPVTGGTLLLPAGTYNLNTPVYINKPVNIVGAGQQSAYLREWGTLLTTSLASYPLTAGMSGDLARLNGLEAGMINLLSPGCVIADVAFRCTNASVVTLRGLVVDIQRPHPTGLAGALVGDSFHMSRTSFVGFNVNADVVNAFEWTITNCQSQDSRTAGFRLASERLPDGGDGSIMGCQIMAGRYDGGYGILQRSGGGLKMVNNKINSGRDGTGRFAYGYSFEPDYSKAVPGSTADTSILLIANNSFENIVTGIKATGITLFSISGNELACYCAAGTGQGIWLTSMGTGTLYGNVVQTLSNNGSGIGFVNAYRLTTCNNTKRGLNVSTGPGAFELIEGGTNNITLG